MKLWFNAPGSSYLTSFWGVREDLTRALRQRGVDVLDAPSSSLDVQINIGHPEPLRRTEAYYRRQAPLVAWYCVCEADRVPESWGAVLDQMVDLVIVPSRFCAEAFRATGTSRPIHLVPHGVHPEEWPRVDRSKASRPWTFVWAGESYPVSRKNGAMVERAFLDLALPGTRLILKWTPLRAPEWVEGSFDRNGIRRVGEYWSRAQMADLYAKSDVLVWPSSGEGFGLPPIEAGATGLPVIAPAWGGPADYLDAEDCYLLRHAVTHAAAENFRADPRGCAAAIDRDHLKSLMALTHDRWYEARTMGEAFAERVRRDWTWDLAAEQLLSALERTPLHA